MAGIEGHQRPQTTRRLRPSEARLTAVERRELEVLQAVHDMCREPDEWLDVLADRPCNDDTGEGP